MNERDDASFSVHTKRLVLRLADPMSQADCEEIIRIYNDPHNERAVSGIKTVADVQEKHRRHGPRPEFCPLTPAIRGMFLLAYLQAGDVEGSSETGNEEVFIGQVHMSFRPEMPYPDLGYALLAPYEGQGYATEAAQAAIRFWQDTVGVKEIMIGTVPDNFKSQKLAERLGFVQAGTFDVVFGHPPNERRETGGLAFVLPGMTWTEGKTMRLTVGAEVEDPEQYGDTAQQQEAS